MGAHTRRDRGADLSSNANGFSSEKVFAQEPSAAATAEDKHLWKGFCEIESEPVCRSVGCGLFYIIACLTSVAGIFQCDA